MATYFHPCKCMNCGLHFGVFSWRSDWKSIEDEDPSIYCPECDLIAIMKWQAVEVEGEIFQHVPGTAELERLGPV